MRNDNQLKKVKCILNLSRDIVGVRFVFDKEEFDRIAAKQVTNKMSNCNTVKLATKGNSYKINAGSCLCRASARALGMMETNNDVVSGRLNYSFRMYNSLGTAKNVQKQITYLSHTIYGAVIAPIQSFTEEPHVVIIIAKPYQIMRIVQGYTYHNGVAGSIKITGNQGICSECTVTPYENNDINVSLLCSNTRFAAKWQDDEMGIGIPHHMFNMVCDGIIKTADPSGSLRISDVKKP